VEKKDIVSHLLEEFSIKRRSKAAVPPMLRGKRRGKQRKEKGEGIGISMRP